MIFNTFKQDLSFTLRQLVKHRVYAVTAILSLALGIGATAAVYSVLYGVLIDPYPYRDANRIAFIEMQDKKGNGGQLQFTLAQLNEIRKAKSVEAAILEDRTHLVATDGETPQPVATLRVTGNGFQFLGAPPILGRLFSADEAPEGAAPPPIAVISFLFWKKHFGLDPAVLGKVLELNQQKYTVIGVVGPRFTWTDADVYVPMLPSALTDKEHFNTLIRLRPGVSPETAASEIAGIVQQIGQADRSLVPQDGYRIKVESLNDGLLGQFKGTLVLLFVAVALLLAIGCGNVSILMLARGTARQQELATRLALGASRLRIMRQLLTEAVLFSVAGGVLGMIFAFGAIRPMVGLLPEYSIPHEVVISLNLPVLLFSTAVSVAIGILAGISPALQFSSPHISETIQSGGTRGSTTSQGGRTRTALLAAQIALTVLMLAGAGAAMRNFVQAYEAQLGFDPHHVLMINLSFSDKSFPVWQQRVNYFDALVEKIRSTPGVASASISVMGPPSDTWFQPVQIPGSALDPSRKSGVSMVGEEYFSVTHIPLLRGRSLTREEGLRGAHLAVISETFAREYFAGSDPIGKAVLPVGLSHLPSELMVAPNPDQPYQIVGVVGDVRNDGLHRPTLPQMYVPSSILVSPQETFLIRTTGDPMALLHAISVNLRTLNQNQAVSTAYALEDYLSLFVWSQERFIAVLFGVFALVALGLATIGLASVVAYTVEQRTREFGIRMALGAPQWNVLRLTLLSTARTTGIGLALGIILSLGASNAVFKWTQSSMRNPEVLASIAAVFLFAATAACLIPARKATRIDPMVALRDS